MIRRSREIEHPAAKHEMARKPVDHITTSGFDSNHERGVTADWSLAGSEVWLGDYGNFCGDYPGDDQ